jgi:hypothetical protein
LRVPETAAHIPRRPIKSEALDIYPFCISFGRNP